MIETLEKFREFCRTSFGKEDGDLVCNFYNGFFNYTLYKRNGMEKHLYREDKINHISKLIERTGKNKFLECVRCFQEDWEKEIVKTHSLKYFTVVVENFKPRKTSQTYYQKSQVSKTIVPTKYKKVREGLGMEFLNWDYTCECGNIIDPWKTSCPYCESSIDWSNA
jgi:hypothetical protein